MKHPEDLLADYVDGTLTDQERAVVRAHLATCETCREEVDLASRVLPALTSLTDEPVPFGVTGPVLAEARRTTERRQPFLQRFQWAVGFAAAACLLLVAVVVGPKLLSGGSSDETMRSAAGVAEASKAPSTDAVLGAEGAVQLERLDVDFDEAAVADLAKISAAEAPEPPALAVQAELAAPDAGIACLQRSGIELGEREQLVRLIEASYLEEPAYIGVLFEGPGAGLPPDHAVVWVVSAKGCRLLTSASQRVA